MQTLSTYFLMFQVRLVYKDNEENIPNFDDLFRDDDDDENEVCLTVCTALYNIVLINSSYE